MVVLEGEGVGEVSYVIFVDENPNFPLSCGHWVIGITNGHFIHAGPLKGTIVSIYMVIMLPPHSTLASNQRLP